MAVFGTPMKWSQPNHSLTIALEVPTTQGALPPYTKSNKNCKFWIDQPSALEEKSFHNSNNESMTKGKNPPRGATTSKGD
eukprot:jgi/Psemu1/61648/gm1.61648_g